MVHASRSPLRQSTPEVPEEFQESRWWYLVAATPAFVAGATFLFLLAIVLVTLTGAGGRFLLFVLVVLGGSGMVVSLLLLVGLRADAKLVEEVLDWTPDRDRYVRRARWGVGAYVVGFLVGTAAWDAITGLLLALVAGSTLCLSAAIPYLRARRTRVRAFGADDERRGSDR